MTIPDVVIKCDRCGFTASESEFIPNGQTDEPLTCPKCDEQSALSDVDMEESCDTCVYQDECEITGEGVHWCKAYAEATEKTTVHQSDK